MEIDNRNELIDIYYKCADEEDYERMVSVFSDDIEYLYPGEEPMCGPSEVETFFEERRETRNTTHDVFRRVHDNETTVCEGTITGELGDEGSFEGSYVGVFEFDNDAERISYVAVYTRL